MDCKKIELLHILIVHLILHKIKNQLKMDYQIFDDLINLIKNDGYVCTCETSDNEFYYCKSTDSFDKDDKRIIKFKYNSVIFPPIYYDLYSVDFLIVRIRIFKKGEYYQICVDVDECDFTDKLENISLHITNTKKLTNIYKYFNQIFCDYKLDNLSSMIDKISQKKDFAISKLFDRSSEFDNDLVFSQINIVMSTRLSKYIKKDKCEKFVINGDFLAKRKKDDTVINYIDFSANSKKQQTEIVDILNSYYDDLKIIEIPYKNEIIFEIKGQEFIRNFWHKYEERFYFVVNEEFVL